jgi:hypothetical protein
MSNKEKQNNWTRLTDPNTIHARKYYGIRELKPHELAAEVCKPMDEAPFIVLVTYEDTIEIWAVKDAKKGKILQEYLLNNREPDTYTLNYLSPEKVESVVVR